MRQGYRTMYHKGFVLDDADRYGPVVPLVQELHRRIPDYGIAPGAEVHFSPGIRQADHLPLVFPPTA